MLDGTQSIYGKSSFVDAMVPENVVFDAQINFAIARVIGKIGSSKLEQLILVGK